MNWGQRLQARGFSATELVLRMTRQDLGNYLGLKIETISRTLTKLAGRGILSVAGREIHILDMAALRAVASGADTQQRSGAERLVLSRNKLSRRDDILVAVHMEC